MRKLREMFDKDEPAALFKPFPTPEEIEAEQASIEAELDAEPPFVVAPLPAYDHDAACPKCRFAAGTTDYKGGYHEACAVPESPERPWAGFFLGRSLRNSLMWARFKRQAAAIPEHFERACPNCKYVWAEAVAAAPSPALAPERRAAG